MQGALHSRAAAPAIGFIESRGERRRQLDRRAALMVDKTKMLEVRTNDISMSGISVFTEEPIAPGTQCAVSATFPFGLGKADLYLAGRSVYCILVGQRGYRVGIQATETSPSTRATIRQLIEALG